MGCHTWYRIPIITDKNEIKAKAQEWLNSEESSHIGADFKKMYQYAIDNELWGTIGDVANYATELVYIEDKLYQDVNDYLYLEYGKKTNNVIDIYDREEVKKAGIQIYGNTPRIGGYPETIIHSFEEMLKFIEIGFDNPESGNHYDFRFDDEERKQYEISEVKRFFTEFPEGIITFG